MIPKGFVKMAHFDDTPYYLRCTRTSRTNIVTYANNYVVVERISDVKCIK